MRRRHGLVGDVDCSTGTRRTEVDSAATRVVVGADASPRHRVPSNVGALVDDTRMSERRRLPKRTTMPADAQSIDLDRENVTRSADDPRCFAAPGVTPTAVLR